MAASARARADAAAQDSLAAQEQVEGVDEHELDISADTVCKEWHTWCRLAASTSSRLATENSPYLALLSGISSLTEAFHCLYVSNKETHTFGVLRLLHATICSGPVFFLLLLIATGQGFYRLFRQQTFFDFGPTIAKSQVDLRVVGIAACLSALSLLSAMLNFLFSPTTDPASRVEEAYLHSKSALLGCALYHGADIVLRALAVICFGYTLIEAGPGAFVLVFILVFLGWAVSIRFLPSTRAALKAYGVRAWLSLGVKALMGLVSPRLLFAVSQGNRLLDALVSTGVGLTLVWIGLALGKDNLDDPELIGGVITAAVVAIICKLAAFFGCVYPALTGKYQMPRLTSATPANFKLRDLKPKSML